jgi:hypothetical protein
MGWKLPVPKRWANRATRIFTSGYRQDHREECLTETLTLRQAEATLSAAIYDCQISPPISRCMQAAGCRLVVDHTQTNLICMRTKCLWLVLYFATQLPALGLPEVSPSPPYIGEWSNGRGELLVITSTTLRFQKDKPVPYRTIPRATVDSAHKLEITARGPVNYFQKFLWLIMRNEKEMIIEHFDSLSQITAGDTSVQHWFRQKKEEPTLPPPDASRSGSPSGESAIIIERVNSFYEKHQTPKHKAVEAALRAEYLTERFQRERAEEDKHPENMDGDPYTLADGGWDVGAIRVIDVRVQGSRAEASVSRGGVNHSMKVSLEKERGKWLIDRIYFPH